MSNQISPFEYVSTLVSIILGLGITQILSAFSDLLYDFKKVKFYWPHSIWVVFIGLLHIQDWFITWQLRDKMVLHLPELFFVLIYPIVPFISAKILLPTLQKEESEDMRAYYFSQFPMLFLVVAFSVLVSILFNLFFISGSWILQTPLAAFFFVLLWVGTKNYKSEWLHQTISFILFMASVVSIFLEKSWVIRLRYHSQKMKLDLG